MFGNWSSHIQVPLLRRAWFQTCMTDSFNFVAVDRPYLQGLWSHTCACGIFGISPVLPGLKGFGRLRMGGHWGQKCVNIKTHLKKEYVVLLVRSIDIVCVLWSRQKGMWKHYRPRVWQCYYHDIYYKHIKMDKGCCSLIRRPAKGQTRNVFKKDNSSRYSEKLQYFYNDLITHLIKTGL